MKMLKTTVTLGLATCLWAVAARAASPALSWGTAVKFDHGYLPTIGAGYTGSNLSGSQYVSVHQGGAGLSYAWWDYGTSNATALVNQNTVSASNVVTPTVALLCAGSDVSSNAYLEIEEDIGYRVYARTIKKTASGGTSWTNAVQIGPISPGIVPSHLAVAGDGSGAVVVTFASSSGTFYMVGQASTGGGCSVDMTPGQINWYTPQLLDGGNQFGGTSVAVVPAYSEVEGPIDLVIAADLTHDADAIHYFTGCLYASPSNGFSKPEPGDGMNGGPLGTIGCSFTTARSLPHVTNPLSVSVAIASINGTINSDEGPGAPAAFATIVFNQDDGACPSMYAETATINYTSVCTVSTLAIDNDECLPNSRVTITWSGSHKYGCGFNPQITYPNQTFFGTVGAPTTIHGIEVHTDNATNIFQIPMNVTH